MSTSFKVICVKSDNNNGVVINDGFNIKEGNIYTVVDICLGVDIYGRNGIGYYLQEQPSRDYCYHPKQFIPLSEIDETELVNEVNKVNV